TLSDNKFDEYLALWRRDLRHELTTNLHNYLKSCQPMLASAIPDDFPRRDVLLYYTNPLTSWSPECHNSPTPTNMSWKPREPTIFAIATFCMQHFGWSDAAGILKKFQSNLWAGVCVRMLCSVVLHQEKVRFLYRAT
ncbi:hypothetical protein BD779DRAFT_1448851, partial [Infundibulicybe gibba]